MTTDEIIRMARESGFEIVDGELRLYFNGSKALLKPNYMGTVVDGLKVFAALVAAHEREACAKVCDSYADRLEGMRDEDYQAELAGRQIGATRCAAAIRARGEK